MTTCGKAAVSFSKVGARLRGAVAATQLHVATAAHATSGCVHHSSVQGPTVGRLQAAGYVGCRVQGPTVGRLDPHVEDSVGAVVGDGQM